MSKKNFSELFAQARKSINLNEYKSYFFKARSLKRKHTLFVGPTNSGKTYNALNKLSQAESGAYLAPLRLLAWEGKQELLKRGVQANLITGEEREDHNYSFSAQTIETLNTLKEVESILIDEVQMIFDKERGWAWTQAIFGSPAKNIIMTGTPEAVGIVKKIVVDILEEDLEIIELKRFNRLKTINPVCNYFKDPGPGFVRLNKQEIKAMINQPAGTAFICFTRNNVLALKSLFDRNNINSSVIYGNLNPEIRREEAEKFSSGKSKYLIATDAIGMGLNLPISKIILTTDTKFDGSRDRFLSTDEIKQICGRAGRYGKFESGEASFLFKSNIRLKDKLNGISYYSGEIFAYPSVEHAQYIANLLNSNSIREIYRFFYDTIRGHIFANPKLKVMFENAEIIDNYKNLTLDEKYLMMACPVPSDRFHGLYKSMLLSFEKKEKYKLLNFYDFVKEFGKTFKGKATIQLMYEFYLKYLNLYHWFALKFESLFYENQQAMFLRQEYNNKIKSILNE